VAGAVAAAATAAATACVVVCVCGVVVVVVVVVVRPAASYGLWLCRTTHDTARPNTNNTDIPVR
jgi:hypothetical protein